MAVETRLVFKVTDKASRGISRMGSSLKALTKTVARLSTVIGGLTAIGGVGSLAFLSKQAFDSGIELKKWSDRLGESVKSMSELRFVASQGGIDMERFTDFIKDFNIRINEAVHETGSAREMFDLLGLSAKDFINLPLTEKVARFADAVRSAGKDIGTLALDIGLSDPGVEVLNILRQGGGAIRGTAASMGAIGGTRTSAELRALEKFNQSMDALKTIIGNLVEKITIELAAPLERLVKKVSNAIENSGIFKPGSFEYLIYLIEKLVLEVMPNLLENFMRMMSNMKVGLNDLLLSLRDIKIGFTMFGVGAGIKPFRNIMGGEGTNKPWDIPLPDLDKLIDAQMAFLGILSKDQYLKQIYKPPQLDAGFVANKSTGPIDQGFAKGFQKGLDQLESEFNKMYGNMAKMGERTAEIVSRSMTQSFESFFFDAIEGRIQRLEEVFKSLFKSIAQQISSILSQKLAANLIGSAFGLMTGGSEYSGPLSRTGAGYNPTGTGGSGVPPFMQFGGGAGAGRGKPTTVEIVNQSGQEVQGEQAYVREDPTRTIIGIVLNGIANNTMQSRDVLRGALA